MDKFLCLFVIVLCVLSTSSIYAEGLTRIKNGLPATENEFPYMISLQLLSEIHTATRGHKCGGVLVTMQHAVTAAYCTLDPTTDREQTNFNLINPADYRVFAGSVLLCNDTSADRTRRIANFTIHPEYNTSFPLSRDEWFVNDIAVITLGTPFLSNTVATLSIRDTGPEIIQCTVSGWSWGTPRLMQAPMLSTTDETFCRLTTSDPLSLPSSTMCAWSLSSNASGCWGDQGGPLVCDGGLVGIFVDLCGTNFLKMQLYTRVSKFTTWIDYVVAQPIPELGPEPPTQTPFPPEPCPAGAPTFKPGMSVLAVVAIVQIMTINVHNKSYLNHED